MTQPAGWYPDPVQVFDYRYWDGQRWTPHVSRSGVALVDGLTPGEPGPPVGLTPPKEDAAYSIIMSTGANALIEGDEVRLNDLAGLALDVGGAQAPGVNWVLERYRRHWGGLWVGGRITLTTEALEFEPNAVNRAIQSGNLRLRASLGSIVRVELLPSAITKTVAIHTSTSVLKVRCFGARDLANAIEGARRI